MASTTAEFVTIKRRFLALVGGDYTQLDTTAKVAVLVQLVKKAAHGRHGVE
jgi:hypothetical protein